MGLRIAYFTQGLLGILFFAGCQETVERAEYTTATLRIAAIQGLSYDSASASVSHLEDTLWIRLNLKGNYYTADQNVNPGVTYSARGWVYIDGILCFFTNFGTSFNLSYGEQKIVSLSPNSQPPPPPDSLKAPTTTSTSITISWLHSGERLSGFQIERGKGSADSLQVVATVSAQVRSYQSTGLLPNTVYYFRLKAFNPAGVVYGISGSSNVLAASTN